MSFFTLSTLAIMISTTFGGGATQAIETIDNTHGVEVAIPIEDVVTNYFKDEPILARIAFCESSFRHYNEKGEVIRGVVDKRDVGVMQINEYYHKSTADRLGLDLETLSGNLEYARNLYKRQGTKPWGASKACWTGHQVVMNR